MWKRKPVRMETLFDEALRYDERYLEAAIHAVELYDSYDQARERIREFLSRKSQWDFKATNPHSKRIWFEGLIDSYLNSNLKDMRPEGEREDEPRYKCGMITFTHSDWVCTDVDFKFDLERAKQKVRNALSGMTFIACFEAAYYVNEEVTKDGKTGKLVSFHCHALVWASSKFKLKRARMFSKSRFKPILGCKSAVRLDVIKSAEGVCATIRYMTKMPFYGYRIVVEGGKTKQKKAKLSSRQNYKLINAMAAYDLLDLWLAGGEGAELMAGTTKSINRRRRERSSGGPKLTSRESFPLYRLSSGNLRF
jgi:hypothetical protein